MKIPFILSVSRIKINIKSSTILALFILICAFLLRIVFSIDENFEKTFFDTYKNTNSSNYVYIIPKSYYEKEEDNINLFLKSYSSVEDYDSEDGLLLMDTTIMSKGKKDLRGLWIIRNIDNQSRFSKFSLVEKTEENFDNAIYLPLICKNFFGFRIGDNLDFQISGSIKKFTVAGFTEDILFGNRSSIAFYVDEGNFLKLSSSVVSDFKAKLIFINSDKNFNEDEITELFKDVPYLSSTSLNNALFSMNSSMNIYKHIVVFFAILNITIVSLIIHLRIKDSLYKECKDIGVMKSQGFTNLQIIFSYIIQYAIISTIGSILGILLSLLTYDFIFPILTAETGLYWINYISIWAVLKILFIILFVIFIIVIITSKSIYKMQIVESLRGYSYTQNPTGKKPVKNLYFSPTLFMSWNIFFSNKRKNVVSSIIIAISVFIVSIFIILFVNIVQDGNGLSQIAGMEKFDIVYKLKNPKDIEIIASEIENYDGVKSVVNAVGPGRGEILCDGEFKANTSVYSNYNKIDGIGLYDGRYPKHDNEVAISHIVSKVLNKGIGDIVILKNEYQINDNEKEYVITGLTQGSYTGGKDIFFTMNGLKKINKEADWQSSYIYLEKNISVDDITQKIKENYLNRVDYIENFKSIFNSQFSSIKNSISSLLTVSLFITLFISMATTFLLVQTIINNNSKTFGILRVMGFKRRQIALQVIMSILPMLAIGTIIGCISSFLLSNDLLIILLSSIGVYSIEFSINILYMIYYIVTLIVSSCLVSLLLLNSRNKESVIRILSSVE